MNPLLASVMLNYISVKKNALSLTHSSLLTIAYTSVVWLNSFLTGLMMMVNGKSKPSLDFPHTCRYLFIIFALPVILYY